MHARRAGELVASMVVLCGCVMTTAALATTSGYGSRANPWPMRTWVKLPETKGWSVRVNSVVPNATAAVLAENQFNDKPKVGRQFYIISMSVRYSGKGSQAELSAGSFSAVGGSNVAYSGFDDSCGVVPKELDEFKTLFSGGSITGNICFSVKRSDVASLKLYFEPTFSLNDTQVFFRL